MTCPFSFTHQAARRIRTSILPKNVRIAVLKDDTESRTGRACDNSFGSACFVTGTVGSAMASVVANALSMCYDVEVARKVVLWVFLLPCSADASAAFDIIADRGYIGGSRSRNVYSGGNGDTGGTSGGDSRSGRSGRGGSGSKSSIAGIDGNISSSCSGSSKSGSSSSSSSSGSHVDSGNSGNGSSSSGGSSCGGSSGGGGGSSGSGSSSSSSSSGGGHVNSGGGSSSGSCGSSSGGSSGSSGNSGSGSNGGSSSRGSSDGRSKSDSMSSILCNCDSGGPCNVPYLRRTTIIDAHCHLQLDPLYGRASEVVATAKDFGVQHLVVCGTCPGSDWIKVIDLSEKFPNYVIPNFGLHPWWIGKYAREVLESSEYDEGIASITLLDKMICCLRVHLEEALIARPYAGVGECGLDAALSKKPKEDSRLSCCGTNEEVGKSSGIDGGGSRDCILSNEILFDISMQVTVLQLHLEVASKYHRPVTIHCVGGACWAKLLEVFRAETRKPSFSVPSIILHSCNSLPSSMVKDFVSKVPAEKTTVYFSLSGRLLTSKKAIELVRTIPKDRLLIETDSPDQLPLSLRDRHDKLNPNSNEPCLVKYNCREIARIRGVSATELAAATSATTRIAFGVLME